MKNADTLAIPVTVKRVGLTGDRVTTTRGGLTKREYFAALAMQGHTSSPLELGKLSHAANKSPNEFVVKQAVAIADALLEELEKS